VAKEKFIIILLYSFNIKLINILLNHNVKVERQNGASTLLLGRKKIDIKV